MATIYNMAGTTSKTFQLGNGSTLICGSASPTNEIGHPGDIYIQLYKELSNVDLAEKISDIPSNPSVNDLFKWAGATTQTYKEGFYYKWNGS